MTRIELEKWFVTKDWEIFKKDDEETILTDSKHNDEVYITDTELKMGCEEVFIISKLEGIELNSVSNLIIKTAEVEIG